MEGQEALKGTSSFSSKCSDCGNQAKKDCSYTRCRTCCKNKGFHCPTHVRSTWIPVDRRRHKSSSSSSLVLMDHHHSSLTTNLHFLHHQHIPKRHKHTPYSSSEEFPASMSSVAIFRCVRVRSMDESVNEIAYQTSVNIGGHVFSGLLYDQGPHQPPPSTSIDPHLHSNTNNLNLMMMSNSSNNNVPTIIDAPPLPHDQPFLSSSTSFVRPPTMPYYFSHPPKP
ncbi:hypothetical protein HN51_010504 [Arachis hypogaea]|uniref:Protein SHI RELATED SEQUENCE n=2 Tax=Arachis TaxID=3817 RepID=A0A445E2X2_ARAHY|nr:protein SHI RELATED SEQUENCE 3 [Arachis duranensis]XP_025669728.1 protein SHI RELATED SEQUENCE 3 [Arachis hypogaea]QHO55596.1 uncharacterized protein DS421_3g66530 [Arachis hypogaea]RYR69780.1 hypothetical protein Ahy_A03g016327 [Arachis hypogaea]